MRVAVVGSRDLRVPDMGRYLPPDTTLIVTGGARGVDTDAARYARAAGLTLTVIRPDYARYGRSAPLRRNLEIIRSCDMVVAFWDGSSRGTAFVIDRCRKMGKPLRIFRPTAPQTR